DAEVHLGDESAGQVREPRPLHTAGLTQLLFGDRIERVRLLSGAHGSILSRTADKAVRCGPPDGAADFGELVGACRELPHRGASSGKLSQQPGLYEGWEETSGPSTSSGTQEVGSGTPRGGLRDPRTGSGN